MNVVYDFSKDNVMNLRDLKKANSKCKYTYYHEHFGNMKFVIGNKSIGENENLKTIFGRIDNEFTSLTFYLTDLELVIKMKLRNDGKYIYDEYDNKITLSSCIKGNFYKLILKDSNGKAHNGTVKNINGFKEQGKIFLLTYNEPTKKKITRKNFWNLIEEIGNKKNINYREIADFAYKEVLKTSFEDFENFKRVKSGRERVIDVVDGLVNGDFTALYNIVNEKYNK